MDTFVFRDFLSTLFLNLDLVNILKILPDHLYLIKKSLENMTKINNYSIRFFFFLFIHLSLQYKIVHDAN